MLKRIKAIITLQGQIFIGEPSKEEADYEKFEAIVTQFAKERERITFIVIKLDDGGLLTLTGEQLKQALFTFHLV